MSKPSNYTVLCMSFNTDLDDLCKNIFTPVGNPQISSEQSLFGTKSLYLDGSSSLYCSAKTDNFTFNSNDFTIEYWEYRLDTSGGRPAILIGEDVGSVQNGILFGWIQNGENGCFISTTTGWNVFNEMASMGSVEINKWNHFAVSRQGNTFRTFRNGTLTRTAVATEGLTEWDSRIVSIGKTSGSFYRGYINNLLVVNGECLYDSDFTPSTKPFSFNSVIYLTGQEAWGIDSNGDFSKLNNNYSTMTDAQKLDMFEATYGRKPTIAQLKTLNMPIKAVRYDDSDTQGTCNITATPKPQTIVPKGLISLENYVSINDVNITGSNLSGGIIKIAVTKDNNTYQVYDTINQVWTSIDINDIGTSGMSLSDISSLTSIEWEQLDCLETGIGFAYYLEIASITDVAYTDEVSLDVMLNGEMKSLHKGTDFDYSYPSNDTLRVKIYKNGNFKLNYADN